MAIPLIAVPLFGIGGTEAIVVGLVILVMFGATRLPRLGRGIGEGIRNFKSSIKDPHKSLTENSDADAPKG